MQRHNRPNGYALLILLIVIAIILVLSAVQMRALFSTGGATHQPVGIESRPWLLEEYLANENESIKLPRSPKPTLDEPITIDANVTLDDARRGTVSIDFGTDGRIQSTWNCQYAYNQEHHTITAEMAGNINVRNTYTDESGKDKSRLFFVAKGRYQKQTTVEGMEPSNEKGSAWIMGWLKPDHTVEGYVSIHQNTDWVAVYPFATTP